MVHRFVERYGQIDALVNNAGRTRFGPFLEVTEERLARRRQHESKRHLFRERRGCWSHAGRSQAERRGRFDHQRQFLRGQLDGAVPLGLHHVEGGSRGSHTPVGSGARAAVRVNCISPAPTSTDRNRGYDPHYDEHWGAIIPMQRVAQPEDMVGVVAFLASEQAAFITGQVIQVDGGWTLKGHTSRFDQGRLLS